MTWFSEKTNVASTGIALAFYPSSANSSIEVQRAADDGGGAPDLGTVETVGFADPGQKRFVDLLPLDGENRHYRTRHIHGTATPSPWTGWAGATPALIPDPLPPVPTLVWTVPVMTIIQSQAGVTGRLTVAVWDPDLLVTNLRFAVKDDAGGYGGLLSSWDSETGTAGTDTYLTRVEDISLVGKHNVALQVFLDYVIDGITKGESRPISFDSDLIAEIQSLGVSFDDDGTVNVHPIADEDTEDIYVTVGVNVNPANPTAGSNHGSLNARSGIIETAIGSKIGDLLTVKAKGADSGGMLGPLFVISHRRTDSADAPPVILMDPTQAGSTGSFDLTITDLALSVTALQFQKRVGNAAWSGAWVSTWDRSGGVAGTDPALTRGEDISMIGKHSVGIKARIRYTDQNGATKYIDRSHTFDADLIAEVTGISISFAADDDTVITAIGDEDTVDMYVTVGDAPPADPTAGVNDGHIAGRTGTVDSGVTIRKGETAFVKVVGKDSGGALGPVSEAQFFREVEPPTVQGVTAVGEDTGANIDWDTRWAKGGSTNDTDHDLTIQYMVNDSMVEQQAGVDVDDGAGYLHTSVGEGNLNPGDLVWVRLLLELKADNSVLFIMESRRMAFVE